MNIATQEFKWDVFISHAREDKEPFVRELVAALRRRGLRVWFDEDVLAIGDSLRRSIDAGLLESRFGIVVLSPHFFTKEWPQKELDALVARDDGREKVILPIWHTIDFEGVKRLSPLLADKLALSTSQGPHAIADAISALVHGEATKHLPSPVQRTMAGRSLDRIRESGRIIVGCICQPPLLDFEEKQGGIEATGLYAMLIEEIAQVEGINIEYVGLRFSETVDAVISSRVDIALGIFPTPARLRKVDFSAFMHRIGVGAVVKQGDTRVKTLDDLRQPNLRIAVVRGEVGWEYANTYLGLANNLDRFKVVEAEHIRTMIELVGHGEVEAALCDSLSCRQYCNEMKESEHPLVDPFIDGPLWKCEVGVMLKKSEPELKEWLSRSFRLARSRPCNRAEEARIMREYSGTIENID